MLTGAVSTASHSRTRKSVSSFVRYIHRLLSAMFLILKGMVIKSKTIRTKLE